MARRGFTLTELLIVIAIIITLVGILMPSVGRARFQAKTVQCAANLRQMSAAMIHHAAANERKFPRYDMINTGANLWDVNYKFVDDVTVEYGMGYQALFCPTIDQDSADARFNQYAPSFRIIGYNVWLPRKNGSEFMPPLMPGDASSKYKYPQPLATESFAGPLAPSDPLTALNPIFTDVIGTRSSAAPPPDADVTQRDTELLEISGHRYQGKLRSLNAAYGDGRVEYVPAQDTRPRFFGNWWNWR